MAPLPLLLLAGLLAQQAGALLGPLPRGPRQHRAAAVVRLRAAADPFRPARPPLAPIVINACRRALEGEDGAAVCAEIAAARAADVDADTIALRPSEEAALRRRVLGTAARQAALGAALAAAVDAHPWIRKYKSTADFGLGDDDYAKLCRAENLLALYMLHVEGAGAEVDFLPEDRLEVLAGAEVVAVAEGAEEAR